MKKKKKNGIMKLLLKRVLEKRQRHLRTVVLPMALGGRNGTVKFVGGGNGEI